jgi:hypothetical protein
MKPSVQLFEIASPSPSAPRARQIDLDNVTLISAAWSLNAGALDGRPKPPMQ